MQAIYIQNFLQIEDNRHSFPIFWQVSLDDCGVAECAYNCTEHFPDVKEI
jgi:hypothetical protein